MRRITMLAGAGLLVLVLLAVHAEAGPVKDMQHRIDKLQNRIDRGIKTGKIGVKQARKFNKTLNGIRDKFNTVKGNPILFALEKGKLAKRLDRLERKLPPLKAPAPPPKPAQPPRPPKPPLKR